MKKRYSAISLLLALSMISGCSDPDDNKIDWDALYGSEICAEKTESLLTKYRFL